MKNSENNRILNEPEKYRGKYVVKASIQSREPVCAGDDPVSLFNKAKEMGIKDPVIFFVPDGPLLYVANEQLLNDFPPGK